MSSQPKPYLTPEQYLALERTAAYKSEYFRGEIFAMAGASPTHVLMVTNIVAALHGQLRQRPLNRRGVVGGRPACRLEHDVAAGAEGRDPLEAQVLQRGAETGAGDTPVADVDSPQEGGVGGHRPHGS